MSYTVKVGGMREVDGVLNKLKFAAFGAKDELAANVKKLVPVAQRIILKAIDSPRYSQLYRAIERMTGKQHRPIRSALPAAVEAKSTKRGVTVGVYGSMSRVAQQLDVGRKAYSVTVTPKMRRFFMAMFIRGLITAPLQSTTTKMSVPALKATKWRDKLLREVQSTVKKTLNKKFG